MSRHPRRTLKEISHDVGPVASFVRERRKGLGYTQTEFAARVGVGLRFLKDLELGKRSARMDKVNLVLAYFGKQLGPIPLTQLQE